MQRGLNLAPSKLVGPEPIDLPSMMIYSGENPSPPWLLGLIACVNTVMAHVLIFWFEQEFFEFLSTYCSLILCEKNP